MIIYSMWRGDLSGDHQNKDRICLRSGVDYIYLHTSGHADVKTIEALINVVRPEVIIPIHAENA